MKSAIEVLKELLEMYDDGAICCDCRNLVNLNCTSQECGIYTVMEDARKVLLKEVK